MNYFSQIGPCTFKTSPAPKSLRLLITGMPGTGTSNHAASPACSLHSLLLSFLSTLLPSSHTGKIFTIDRIAELAEMFNSGHVATMAYTGIAACNIGGSTLSSILCLDT